MNFSELVQSALLGTERQPLPPLTENSPLGELLRRIPGEDRATALLTAAAVVAGHERVGRRPERLSGSAPPPSPAESQPRASAAAGELLRRILDGEHPFLGAVWCALATAWNQVAPALLLPGLLDLGVRESACRESLLAVVGERGRWLAGMRESWAWVAGERWDESQWQTGDVAARVLFLRQLRRTEPPRALALLEESWKQESPEDRVRLLGALDVGLNAADEAFLETVLRDKRKEARRLAADYLVRLPQSGLGQRFRERAFPLLNFVPATPGGLLKLKKAQPAKLEVTWPEACPADWQRDGVEARPISGFGEKASWLIQLLEGTPLSTWTDAWGVGPATLFAASQEGDWSKELGEAWARAAIRQRHAAWALASLDWVWKQERQDLLEPLLRLLPVADRERQLAVFLTDKKSRRFDQLGETLLMGTELWSSDFSATVLGWLRAHTAKPSSDWMLRNQLKLWAARLHPGQLTAATQGWPTTTSAWDFWSKGVDEFLSVVQFRQELHAAFAGTPGTRRVGRLSAD